MSEEIGWIDYIWRDQLVIMLNLLDSFNRSAAYFNIGNKYFRLNGPMVMDDNGDRAWSCYGLLDNFNEPVVINHNGYREWWVNDEFVRCIKYW